MKNCIKTLLFFLVLMVAASACAEKPAQQVQPHSVTFVTSDAGGSALEGAVLPENGSSSPTLIINGDSRTPITDVSSFPYSAIAFLDVICECGCGWECSGFLAGKPNVVITSAHSLVCADHGAPAESVILYWGYESYRKNLVRYDGPWKAWVGNHYESHEYTFENDWGILLLEEDVGNRTGMLEIDWDYEAGNQKDAAATICGYSAGRLYTDKGPFTFLDSEHYQYQMDQDTGSSGGPILDENNRVIGIVIGHMEDDDGVLSNIGIAPTREMRQVYESLVSE